MPHSSENARNLTDSLESHSGDPVKSLYRAGQTMKSYSSLSVEELVRRCSSSDDAAAWEEFVRRMHRLIAKVVLRTAERLGDGTRQTVDDLIQETYLKLCADNCRILRNFDHRHSGAFLGFVQVVAANVVRDYFRSSYERHRSAGHLATSADGFAIPAAENSTGGSQSIEREVLIQEVGRHLENCASGHDQERNTRVFWLYYRTGLSSAAIAALPGIGLTTKGVESLILRMTRDVRERMAAGSRSQTTPGTGTDKGIRPAESF